MGNTSDNPDYVVSQGTQVIVDAMKRLGQPKRIVIVSSMGVGESKDQVSFTFKMLMTTVLRKPMEDKERQEAVVKASGLDWTIVRPGGLTDSPATGSYKSGLDPEIGAGQVSRADVAAFVLKQLTDFDLPPQGAGDQLTIGAFDEIDPDLHHEGTRTTRSRANRKRTESL